MRSDRRSRRWPGPPSARRLALVGTGAVIVAAAVGVALGSGGVGGSAAQTVVAAAARASLDGRTATVAAVGTIRSGGLTEGYSMAGSAEFDTDADHLQGTEVEAGARLPLEVVTVGGLTYESFAEIARVDPGKTWVSLDPASVAASSQGSTAGGPAGDLGVWLEVLTGSASSVRQVGGSVVRGAPVRQYQVTIPPAVIDAAIRQAGLDGPSSAVTAVSVTSARATVSVDGAGHVARESLVIVERAGPALQRTGVRTTTIRTRFDFGHYGARVSIQPPPAGQVVPFATFLQMASAGVQTLAARTT